LELIGNIALLQVPQHFTPVALALSRDLTFYFCRSCRLFISSFLAQSKVLVSTLALLTE
jgi:hypothetical protein